MFGKSCWFRPSPAAWSTLLASQIVAASVCAAPVITAKKNDNVPAATQKAAGSTVTYKSTITNSGDAIGSGMYFSDPDVANTLLTGGVKVTPIAHDDAFATVGNTRLVVSSVNGLLANDHDPDSVTFTVKSGSVSRVSATGTANATPGTLAANSDGSFTYVPGIGATGTERWQYTITDGDAQDSVVPGYVDFSITGRVWYVQAGYSGAKTGRSHEPFDSPASASTAANASTDIIYVLSSGSALNGLFTLENGQNLLGQGVDLTVGALTPFRAATPPTLTNTGGNIVVVGGSNTISGVILGNRSAAALSGSNFGTLTVTPEVVIQGTGQALSLNTGTLSAIFTSISASAASNAVNLVAIDGALNVNGGLLQGISGDDIVINGGKLAVTWSGIINNTSGRPINIFNKTVSGNVTFNGRINDSGTGILLNNNGGAIVTLKSLGSNTGANTAITATNGGTVVVTDGLADTIDNDLDGNLNNPEEANTIATTTATALHIANTSIGSGGLTFKSISVNGASTGILLNNTGSSGGLTVTGTGSIDGSGGTIQNTVSRGASFINARHITLANMNFINAATADFPGSPTGLALGNNTADNASIHLQGVFNATLDNLNINGSAEHGINGHGVTNFRLLNSVLSGLGGGPDEDGIHFFNMLGSCAITNTSITGSGDDNINIQNNTNLALPAGMTANATIAINGGSANAGLQGSGYLFGVRGTSNTTITISGATSDNNFSGGIVADCFDTATMALDVAATSVTNNNDGIQVSSHSGVSSFNIHDNSAFSGQDFAGISVVKSAFSIGGTLSGTIQSNTLSVPNGRPADAIFVSNAGGGALNVGITNNTIDYAGTQRAILVQSGQDGKGSIRTHITGNAIDIRLDGLGDAVAGMLLQAAITSPSGNGASIDAKIGGAASLANTFTHSLGGILAAGDIRVRQRNDGTFNLDGYGGGATDTNAVVSYLSGRNTTVSSATASAQSTGFTGIATPGVPLLFASGEPEEFEFGTPDSETSAVVWTEAVRQESAELPSTALPLADAGVSKAKPASAPSIPLSQSQLDVLVAAARGRWQESGLSADQSAALEKVIFEVADLPGWYLGEANGQAIRIDNNAGGNGWFIDATPTDDGEYSGDLQNTEAGNHVDLLTTLLHEMGHSLGLCDSYAKDQRDRVMYGFLTKGERRVPKFGEAAGAVPHPHATPHFLGAPIEITGGLPPGKAVVITYTVTIADPLPLGAQPLSSQATVTGNFTDVLTDDEPSDGGDPILPGNADPTITLLDRPDTTVVSLNRSGDITTNSSSVTWQIVFADPVLSLTSANFVVVSSGLTGATAISPPVPTGPLPTTTWTVSASSGTGDGTIVLNLANDTGFSHDVTNTPFAGQAFTIDRTGPEATIGLSDVALKIGDSSTVTITFTEPVSGFTNDDLTIPNGSLTSVSSVDNVTWTATLTPDDLLTAPINSITLNKAGVTDLVGNAGVGTTGSANYAIDTVRPTVTIAVTDTELMIGETSPVIFTFSEAVNHFTNDDLVISNGTLTPVTSLDGIIWTATLTPTAGVTAASNVITVDNTTLTDLAGNVGVGSTDSNDYAMIGMTLAITADALSANEGTGAGNSAFSFTVSRLGSTTAAVTMDYAVSGLAVDGADFGGSLPAGTVTIPAGQASTTLIIQPVMDSTVELDEAFSVTLSNPGDGVITTVSASAIILNDDRADVSLAGGSVNEGDSGTTPLVFTVSLSNPVDVDVTVNRQTLASGSATVGTDFTALADATLIIPAGDISATFDVSVNGDNDVETSETIDAAISNLSASGRNVTMGSATATGTIIDDDPLLVAANGSLAVKIGTSGKLKIANLLALTSPVEGRPVSLVSVQNPSSAGATVTIVNGWIYYQPSSGSTGLDTFTYTITDSVQTVNGSVVVTIATDSGTTLNVYRLTDEPGGKRLHSLGIPGRNYQMQTTEDMTVWTPQGEPQICPIAGVMSFLDPIPLPPARFYRVVEFPAP